MADSDLVRLLKPPCNEAVTRAIHDADPDKFHEERLPSAKACPVCPTLSERLTASISPKKMLEIQARLLAMHPANKEPS